ncbi:hypothetical protein LOK49_LG06G02579 [Camellia lanceoleosa]|uniref:Uncharacterized protein n=1 Tax=Camellia lanceoleosa TaxID=1840588 RepID=A0ACC0H8I5_9ERIC|nr:hypothetical protein LOK49_LG06G02579 [Camellia lanceoleosa]
MHTPVHIHSPTPPKNRPTQPLIHRPTGGGEEISRSLSLSFSMPLSTSLN